MNENVIKIQMTYTETLLNDHANWSNGKIRKSFS